MCSQETRRSFLEVRKQMLEKVCDVNVSRPMSEDMAGAALEDGDAATLSPASFLRLIPGAVSSFTVFSNAKRGIPRPGVCM